MSEWKEVALTDLGRFSSGKPIAPGTEGPFKAFGSNGVIGGSLEARYSRGIIIGRVGAYCGSVAISHGPFWASDNTLVFEPQVDRDLDFLYYLLRSANLNQYAGGSAQPLVTQRNLKVLRFSIPEPSDRIRIGRILANFDDLIENNRRQVAVLEEMARAIYREWFVKFRYPGHENVPLVDSELGPIPQGWEVKTVAALSSIVTRGIAPKYAPDGESTVLNQKCIRDERVSFDQSRQQEKKVPDDKLVRRGDVLINSTGVGTLGRTALYRSFRPNVTVDSHITIVRPSADETNPWFGVSLVEKKSNFEALATGSTGQTELRRVDIEAEILTTPPLDICTAFGEIAWPIYDTADELLETNARLAALRDLLLPKLVTGEIDVSDLDLDALMVEQVMS